MATSNSRWSVKDIRATQIDMNGTDTGYGNEFNVKFEMVYEKSPAGRFEEMPLLDWDKKFTVLDHANRTWWTVEANFYANFYNNRSRTGDTLKVWTLRYVTAYNTAMNLDSGLFGGLGSCTLYTTKSLFGKENKKVTKLKDAKSNQEKADVVREYLRTKGGKLEIVMIDRASWQNRPEQPINKERLMLFIDVGVKIPGSRKWNGYQHLVVNNERQTRDASAVSGRQDLVPPPGYTKVNPPPPDHAPPPGSPKVNPPPPDVATRKDFPLLAGECSGNICRISEAPQVV